MWHTGIYSESSPFQYDVFPEELSL